MKNLLSLLLAACCIFIASPASAQAPQFKAGENYTAFGLGIGLPVGSFGATTNLDTDGFAQLGFAMNLDDSFFITENFAILLSGYLTLNPYNASALSSALSSSGLSNVSVSGGNFFGACLTIGPTLVLPVGERFNVKLRSGAGISFWDSPEYTISVQGREVARVTRASSLVFAYLLGAGIGYKLSDGWELQLIGDFQGARPTFRFRDPSGRISEGNLNTSIIATSLVIAVRF